METTEEADSDEEAVVEQEVLALQSDSVVPKKTRQTMKLLAQIGKQKVLILVDSGSIGTFVSDQLVHKLHLKTIPCPASTFRAADGGIMLCDHKVAGLQWYIQGYSFESDAKVLPLKCHDVILGEDWLEEFTPMVMDYRSKTMQFTHLGKPVKLQGAIDNTTTCTPVSAHKLKGLIKHGEISHCVQMTPPPLASVE